MATEWRWFGVRSTELVSVTAHTDGELSVGGVTDLRGPTPPRLMVGGRRLRFQITKTHVRWRYVDGSHVTVGNIDL